LIGSRRTYDPALPEAVDELIEVARTMVAEDEKINRLIGEVGADLLAEGSRVLTHCNAGALACVAHGTALSIVEVAHQRGLVAGVTATETRPLLQGSRLTAWELKRMGVRHRVTIDSGAAGLIASGEIDVVITGADRVAANGDVANKVGTYPLALAARANGVPFVVAAPLSTIDLDTPDGERHPHRATIRVGGARSQRLAGRPGRHASLQPGLRRHAGEPRLGYRDRARHNSSRRGRPASSDRVRAGDGGRRVAQRCGILIARPPDRRHRRGGGAPTVPITARCSSRLLPGR
jgi:hypothetical protein